MITNKLMTKFSAKLSGYFSDIKTRLDKEKICAYYFDGDVNIGDLLTPYIIKKRFNLLVKNRKSGITKHVLAVGSIMHNANYNSYIWGSGFISPNHIPKKLDTQKIRALRGKKSFLLIKENYDCNFKDVPLGDPGLIMPTLYTPAPNEKKYKLGIIPHYIDINKIPETVHSDNCVKVLNVMQEPEKFIDELCQCENIISSSLHGLILSDAYGIRNKWAIFSDKIVGGGFKFLDYYSTT